MSDDILSPLSREAVAEQAFMEFMRKNAVFAPPQQSPVYKDNVIYKGGSTQSVDIMRLLGATLKFIESECKIPPNITAKILVEELRKRV